MSQLKNNGYKSTIDLKLAYLMIAPENSNGRYKKRNGKKWVIYTNSLSSMLDIENNRENYPKLNYIYDILAELQNKENRSHYAKILHTW